MFEKSLVRQCATTMAGIKTGSLFSYEMNQKQLQKKVKKINKILEKYSIKLLNLCYKKLSRSPYGKCRNLGKALV